MNYFQNLTQHERQLTQSIIEHIAEVDRRKLFLKMAHASLFDYLTKEMGYSAGAAQRRIDAARLIRSQPQVSEQIAKGSLNLSQISKMQHLCRQIKKETGQTPTTQMQNTVLAKLQNQNGQQTDLIQAKEFNVQPKMEEKRVLQKDESTRIELTFSKEEMLILKSAQESLSNKTGGSLKEVVLELACQHLQKQKKISQTSKPTTELALESKITSTMEVISSQQASVANIPQTPKALTPRLRRQILQRDQCYQYRDKISGKICGSKYFLQIDHIQPRFANGSNAPNNLRILCSSHNIYRYKEGC